MFDTTSRMDEPKKLLSRRRARQLAWLPATLLATAIAHGTYAKENGAFTKSNIFFELNNTDGDLGIHAELDGDGWDRITIDDPDKTRILDVSVTGRLQKQGLTEFFTESAEPPFDELPPEEFFARFPEGEYKLGGRSIEGGTLSGVATLSHVMPAAPANVRVSGLPAAKDCENGPVPVAGKPVRVTWDPVTKSHPKLGKTGPVTVEQYELVVEREEPTSLTFSVDLAPEATSFDLPATFVALDSGDGFKFEIVVRESSGNQTVLESCFKVKASN